jgi:hypothetical protein
MSVRSLLAYAVDIGLVLGTVAVRTVLGDVVARV